MKTIREKVHVRVKAINLLIITVVIKMVKKVKVQAEAIHQTNHHKKKIDQQRILSIITVTLQNLILDKREKMKKNLQY